MICIAVLYSGKYSVYRWLLWSLCSHDLYVDTCIFQAYNVHESYFANRAVVRLSVWKLFKTFSTFLEDLHDRFQPNLTQNLDEIRSGFIYVEIESYVFIQGKIINNYEKIVGKIFSKTTRAEKNQTYVRASSGSVGSSFKFLQTSGGGATNGDWILK